MERFKDRRDAGRRLAEALEAYRGRDVIVLALPRGGVPVGFEVARRLGSPLDVLVVRKVGAPGHEELAMGAVAQGGVVVRNDDVVASLDVDDATFDRVAHVKADEVEQRLRLFRGDALLPDVTGKVALVVDDGVATGSTALAAVQALRAMGPERIVIAVPVLSPHVLERLQGAAEVVYLVCREDFYAVGQWYEDFTQVPDEEVVRLLQASWHEVVS